MTLVRNEPWLKFCVVFSVLDLTHMDFNGSVLNQPVTRGKRTAKALKTGCLA